MGDSVNGITSQYPQHVPLLPYMQAIVGQQVYTYTRMNKHTWTYTHISIMSFLFNVIYQRMCLKVSSKQRQQMQMGNWANGITSPYPQHAPLHPYMQHEPVPVNTHDTVGQQVYAYICMYKHTYTYTYLYVCLLFNVI